jgi:hypothetical protein
MYAFSSIVGDGHCQPWLPVRYHRLTMLSLLKSLIPAKNSHDASASLASAVAEAITDAMPESLTEEQESTILRTVGWVSAGLGALALGLFVGRELRQRYKFNRRTPYDFYAHSGDEMQDVEFGVGI